MIVTILSNLGNYLWPVILLLVEVVLLLLILMHAAKLNFLTKDTKGIHKGQKIYLDTIEHSSLQAQLVVHHEKRMPVFMTDNVSEMLHVSWDELCANLMNMANAMSESSKRQFSKQYDQWNRNEPLTFVYQDNNTHSWTQIQVTKASNPDYDFIFFEDITDSKNMEMKMNEKLIQAESISQSKTTFLSRMSHEIRTPMNGIIGILTLMRNQPHNQMIDAYLDKADNLSAYLLSLINDILDISRIENDKLELEHKPFDLLDIAGEVRNMFQKNVEAKGVAFTVETNELPHHLVVGDRLRLSQIVINFVSNASKFTEHGEITVTFKEMICQDEKLNFLIRVHDTGKGMNPEFVDRIFKPFEQEDTSIARKYGGTGLGMAISEQIVHLMGGEIMIDTMPDRGSDFTVYLTLPVAHSKQMEKEKPIETFEQAYSFAGKHILMAEDNPMNAEIGKEILTQMGARVDIAEDGQVVVNMFKDHPVGTYDFILMDIQMPVMNGREASLAIRDLDRSDAKDIPIFALSADAFVEDQRLSAAAKMNGHFEKPVNYKKLEAGIGQYILNHQKSPGG